jgi:hydrogenase maturation factor
MTGLAVIAGINVGGILASRYRVVMAGHTGAVDLGVIDSSNRLPGCIVMTGFTHITGAYVRSTLTRGMSVVMTHRASLTGQAMIKHRHGPCIRHMATIACY